MGAADSTPRPHWRRNGLARAVVIGLALVVAGLGYSLLVPNGAAGADGPQSQQIEEGRKLFAVGCASCHGLNAEGGSDGEGRQAGPPLIGVGAAAVDFQVGTGRMPATQTGAQAPQKEPVYTDEEIAALAAYVASLAPGPAIPATEVYDVSNATDEEIARGGELFRTNCTACHNFAGRGGALPNGRYAPSLMNSSPRHIYEAMLTGPQQMPVFSDQVLLPQDKRDVIAYVVSLQDQKDPGGFGLGRLGPVSEGLWGWFVGIGALIAVAVWIGAKAH
ncbi:ubiquinol-cytochrome c reductase cytochrome c subunit [Kribbella orskensis]|uniref:Cytochrome bc1 complex cytochrome c subunit n=1 Tax=Kribbella orskensis TaxID=2512216 RepID=A0ABY2BTG1_9ACTN|nr:MULTISPECIES: c-type cytochrome [Kribbella]TCN44670.1 ubiquinol-cytochrome c reductase cytochrome c subunit [Kribbella sp. VKM Ac-2500]TCO31552.1 ubiquinol-cytochrome c reductase cytochrome c subunit [Kribbella orskensis]